jgi:CHAT domain-containing protein/tetratricopeptide (TPR) repeat protein
MHELQRLCKTIDQLADGKDWDAALEAAAKLWRISRDIEIADPELRLTYARTLIKVSDLFYYRANDPYGATQVLRRAYEFGADEKPENVSMPALQESAAYRLGQYFQEAKCYQSALFWFKRSLQFARQRPVEEHRLLNLYGVAWNLELLQRYGEARPYYDEMLPRLWPAANRRLLLDRLSHLMPAAMYHLHYGDPQLGEAVMLKLQSLLGSGSEELPGYLAAGLLGLGNLHLAQHRRDDAVALAQLVMAHAERFGEVAGELRNQMHGLIARAALHAGDFDSALEEIGKVYDLNPDHRVSYGTESFVENLELWRDVARIRAHRGDYVGAARAYETLAQALGVYAADGQTGKTARMRMAWIERQSDVVHELVSVWLTIDDAAAKHAIDATVVNALLQLKANVFLANGGNRLVTFRNWEGVDKALFDRNRRFAAAARRLAVDPANLDAALDLEDVLFSREQIESRMVASSFDMMPALASVFHYDFRDLQSIEHGAQTLLDYSLIEFRPPKNGLQGPALGRRYIGVRLSSDGVRIEDLGSQEQIDALSVALISEVARRPAETSKSIAATPDTAGERHLRMGLVHPASQQSLPDLAERIYQHVIKPLEPIGTSLVIAPDGSLAALPFHALIHEGRYLIEDYAFTYGHSLLREEAVTRSPGLEISIDRSGVNRDMVLLGEPDYSDGSAAPLPNAGVEVKRIAALLAEKGWSAAELHDHVGPEATVSRVTAVEHPRVLHLAAHGAYLPASAIPVSGPGSAEGSNSWHRWEDQCSAPLSSLDQALIRAVLMLSPQDESHDDPAAGRLLTALELSSLNLAACRLVVLSACETGVGQPEPGAGVLGFQYALLTSLAHASLVSLWSVPDRETSDLMDAFYRRLTANNWDTRLAYLATLRDACRQQGNAVHPYYWGAFVLLGSFR